MIPVWRGCWKQSRCDCFVGQISGRISCGCAGDHQRGNLASIRDALKPQRPQPRSHAHCEHFFECYKEDAAFALAAPRQPIIPGARWWCVATPNGGTLPHEW